MATAGGVGGEWTVFAVATLAESCWSGGTRVATKSCRVFRIDAVIDDDDAAAVDDDDANDVNDDDNANGVVDTDDVLLAVALIASCACSQLFW